MKKSGFIILIIGLLIASFPWLSALTENKNVEVTQLEITQSEERNLPLSPLIGVIIMGVGAAVFVLGEEKRVNFLSGSNKRALKNEKV